MANRGRKSGVRYGWNVWTDSSWRRERVDSLEFIIFHQHDLCGKLRYRGRPTGGRCELSVVVEALVRAPGVINRLRMFMHSENLMRGKMCEILRIELLVYWQMEWFCTLYVSWKYGIIINIWPVLYSREENFLRFIIKFIEQVHFFRLYIKIEIFYVSRYILKKLLLNSITTTYHYKWRYSTDRKKLNFVTEDILISILISMKNEMIHRSFLTYFR